MATQGNLRGNTSGAGIYIDIENLGLNEVAAKNVIRYTLANWDGDLPRITSISIYGKATKTLWGTAIESMVDELQGRWPFANDNPRTQLIDTSAYGKKPGKNTADIKLAIDACQDMLSGAVSFIAVLSNDSDFFSLYEKVKELKESPVAGCPNLNLGNVRNGIPFLIINHPAGAGVSSSIENLVPSTHRKKLPPEAKDAPIVVTDEEIAEATMREIDIGAFTNSSIQRVIIGSERLSKHSAAKMNAVDFDLFVEQSIWTLLEKYGVHRLQSTPAMYAMPQEAKNKPNEVPKESRRFPSTPSNIYERNIQSSSETPRDEDIINEVVKERSIGGFRFWQARTVITSRWPDYPVLEGAAFDNEFLHRLIVRELAKENPRIQMPRDRIARLYEITPAAKGQDGPTLTELAKEVVSKGQLDEFKVSDVETIIGNRWPNYGSVRGWGRLDLWFHFNLWPLLKRRERDAGRGEGDMPEDGIYRLDSAEIEELRQHYGIG